MDANKFQKLQDISYEIKPSCGTCKHFKQYSDAEFGDCQIHEYTHQKHSGGQRKLSVVQYGSCNSYEQGEVDWMHGFAGFLV